MDLTLKPPASHEPSTKGSRTPGRRRGLTLDADKRDKLELKIQKMVNHWKQGASPLHKRLRDLNDHLEGVVEDVPFPWADASKITTGFAAGMARTLRAVFDRAVFPDQEPFAVKPLSGSVSKERNEIEDSVNWLAMEDCNLVSELRDSPIPTFRDGTTMLWGEWQKRIEKAVDYKTYKTPEEFQDDYPTAEDAGIKQESYDKALRHLGSIDASIMVDFVYDEIIYDAPKFETFALHRFVFFPLTAPEITDCVLYGKAFTETHEEATVKMKRGLYDSEATKKALDSSSHEHEDIWSSSRDSIEGLSRQGDEVKRLECYKLVLRMDLDEDGIPEKYLLTYEHRSRRILRIDRYGLRKNIDCIVPFRFIKRDGRLLGVSMLDDGMDGFEMIDSIHRHRQNVRAITDSPALIIPNGLKEYVDLGAEDMTFRPGLTFWVPDRYMKNEMLPRQMVIQSLSKTGESLDEEQSLVRYLEFRLGPSQGLSGQESMIDPRAPATKHLAKLRQATLRIDDLIREWKRSIPQALKLMTALYYQYAGEGREYGTRNGSKNNIEFKELKKDLFKTDGIDFELKHQEISLSPEFEVEKVMNAAAVALQNPVLLQMKPQLGIELWNRYVLAAKMSDPDALTVELPGEDSPLSELMKQGNQAPQDGEGNPDLGGITPNQEGMAAFNVAPPRAEVPTAL